MVPRACRNWKAFAPSGTCTRMKLAAGGHVREPELAEAGRQLFEAGAVHLAAAPHELGVIERGDRRRLRHRVDVERRARALEQRRDVGPRVAIADAQAGEAVDLGERARAQHRPALGDERTQIGRVVLILGVGLVEHEEHVLGQAAGECDQLRLRCARCRWGCSDWPETRRGCAA